MSKTFGGAASAAFRAIRTQPKTGIQVTIAYGKGPEPEFPSHRISFQKRFPGSQLNRLRLSLAKKGRAAGLEAFTPTSLGYSTPLDPVVLDGVDLVNLHWIGDRWVDLPSLINSIPTRVPIVLTMHDAHAMTGGCHYPNRCDQYKTSCQKCPQLPGLWGVNLCRKSLSEKARAYSKHTLAIVTNTGWMQKLATQSTLSKQVQTIQKISTPVRLPAKPLSKEDALVKLKLDPTKKIILFGAQDTANIRKGFHILQAAIALKTLDAYQIVTFGNPIADLSPNIIQLGYLEDSQLIRLAYAAADVFCMPSNEENQAQTGMESLMEGTPVVCMNGTGPCDYVLHEETGLRCPSPTGEALADTLQTCLATPQLQDRAQVLLAFQRLHAAQFSEAVCAQKYHDLYRNLLT